jgi:hypothetical protein
VGDTRPLTRLRAKAPPFRISLQDFYGFSDTYSHFFAATPRLSGEIIFSLHGAGTLP